MIQNEIYQEEQSIIFFFAICFKTQLEKKLAYFFWASFNPFPSLPSVTTDDSKLFQCSNKVIGSKTTPLFLVSIDAKTSFSFLKCL